MKITRILAVTAILSGAILFCIGLWQLWDIKRQEGISLNAARELVREENGKSENGDFNPLNGEVSGLLIIQRLTLSWQL